MGLNEKWKPDGGAADVAAVRPGEPVSAAAWEDDLPRFCLELEPAESNRALAWVISICLAYLIVGLIGIRPPAHVVGGSHAQRDVIDLTLIAAAARAGQARLARALVAERASRKPTAEAAARQLLDTNSG